MHNCYDASGKSWFMNLSSTGIGILMAKSVSDSLFAENIWTITSQWEQVWHSNEPITWLLHICVQIIGVFKL